LCGCGLLGVGIWLSVSQGSFATFSPSFPSLSAANLVIAIGAIVMVTGFLGCLGAIKENKCLLLSVSYDLSLSPARAHTHISSPSRCCSRRWRGSVLYNWARSEIIYSAIAKNR
jgi:hypothetical protein